MNVNQLIEKNKETLTAIANLGLSPNRNSDMVQELIGIAKELNIDHDIPECTSCNDKLKNMAKAILNHDLNSVNKIESKTVKTDEPETKEERSGTKLNEEEDL